MSLSGRDLVHSDTRKISSRESGICNLCPLQTNSAFRDHPLPPAPVTDGPGRRRRSAVVLFLSNLMKNTLRHCCRYCRGKLPALVENDHHPFCTPAVI